MAAGSHKQRKARKDYAAQTRTLMEIADPPRQLGYSKIDKPPWQHYEVKKNAKVVRETS